MEKREKFVSGEEEVVGQYSGIYPFDDPRYATPQQKEFQISLNEHPALDDNLQKRRTDIATQFCKLGEKCFNSAEYHELNYGSKSGPAILNTKISVEPRVPPCVSYIRHEQNTVLPSNGASYEKRADLFDDVVITDLFFKRATTCMTNS